MVFNIENFVYILFVFGTLKRNQMYLEIYSILLLQRCMQITRCVAYLVSLTLWINFTLFSTALDFFSMNVKDWVVNSSIIKPLRVLSQRKIILKYLKKGCKIWGNPRSNWDTTCQRCATFRYFVFLFWTGKIVVSKFQAVVNAQSRE